MLSTAAELLVAPALVAVATVVAWRWGERAGGLVSAFPAIVGPVLLVVALAPGARFAAAAANGTLLGLVSLAAFALGYARAARGRGWPASLISGWGCAALAGLAVGLAAGRAGSPAGVAAAAASLGLAYRAMPAAAPSAAGPRRRRATLPLRMATAAVLVALLAAAAGVLGALVGGMLAALPVLACVLAAFTHREAGAPAAIALLRGMLVGMAGFVIFCQLIAMLIGGYGIAFAFAAATVAALAVQGGTLYAPSIVQSLLRRHSSAARLEVAAAPGSWRRQSS